VSFERSVGWADCSCNPIKGLCLNKCRLPDGRVYCYYSGERGFARRFNQDKELRLDLSVFDDLPQRTGKRVFLCSTNDYWGDWIPDLWRQMIRAKADMYDHIYFILTQFPQNIDGFRPAKSWVGVTITGIQKQPYSGFLIDRLLNKNLPLRFVSFEPLLARIDQRVREMLVYVSWVIIGRLTGYGHKFDPKLEWLQEIVEVCREAKIPIFLKDNLAEIWQGELIQERP